MILSFAFYSWLLLHSIIYMFFLGMYVLLPFLFCSHEANVTRLRQAIKWYGLLIVKVSIYPFIKTEYRDLSDTSTNKAGIYIANHRSASDAFFMAFLDHNMVQILNIWPFKVPLLGYIAKKAEYLSINEMDFENFTKKVTLLLNKGISIVAFPEGRRSGDKKVASFNGSLFRIALLSKAPIYPLCLVGNENIPKRDFTISTGRIKVHKLPPILWKDYKDMSSFKLKNYVRDIIIAETAKMEVSDT